MYDNTIDRHASIRSMVSMDKMNEVRFVFQGELGDPEMV